MEVENFLKLDPDPFDDRHPGRVDPNCALGDLFTSLFKNDDFMAKVSRSDGLRIIASCPSNMVL